MRLVGAGLSPEPLPRNPYGNQGPITLSKLPPARRVNALLSDDLAFFEIL